MNSGNSGGVEMWRGVLGWAYPLADPFGCRCLTNHTVLRFHIPLFKPDVRLACIPLSDKDSRFRPRQAVWQQRSFQQPQRIVEVLNYVPHQPATVAWATAGIGRFWVNVWFGFWVLSSPVATPLAENIRTRQGT